MRTSNPALSSSTFENFRVLDDSDVMTVNGTALKTGILLILAAAAAAITWTQTASALEGAAVAAPTPLIWGGAIAGLVFAIATIFKPNWAPYTAPLYALAEGLFLGGISKLYDHQFNGIAFQAMCLTFGTLFAMLVAYQSGWIRATEKFKMGIMAATGAIFLVYLISMVLRLFGAGIPLIHEAGLVGIGFSLFVVVIAALNLVLDFDMIEEGAARGAPKFMEWYGAFGLMVTLVWLYLEILRLLAKISSRD